MIKCLRRTHSKRKQPELVRRWTKPIVSLILFKITRSVGSKMLMNSRTSNRNLLEM